MPRELWAKIAVEITRDPKLLPREPWERWLWLGLICLTKENANGDATLRGYSPHVLSSVLNLRVSAGKVRAALEVFAAMGMIRLHADNDAIELLHFKKRQEAGLNGTREQAKERKERWKERQLNGAGTPQSTAPERMENVIEEEEEEEEEEDQAVEEDRSVADGRPPPPPPVALLPQKPDDPLVCYLQSTWPSLENPGGLAGAWRTKWRGVDLLAESKNARAYELETTTTHKEPAKFLRGWMRRAAENPGQGRPGGRSGFMQEGTLAWDQAKVAADERAKRERERTKELLAARERAGRE